MENLLSPVIDLTKLSFLSTMEFFSMTQDQMFRNMNLLMENMTAVHNEGKKINKEWMDYNKKSSKEWEKLLDEGFQKARQHLTVPKGV